ncbi:hypothetical protein K2173_028179 [Erythroxylum novogranatense]|uniref:RWP-RK domain-containing protein n=1 Tax=Erythroxylum novogranatense TaxID=1862640 RepID=A0AAV8U122_9ROSI|nr:hypothetical protein K2173_028179 [Erythroxylum novogranatense]
MASYGDIRKTAHDLLEPNTLPFYFFKFCSFHGNGYSLLDWEHYELLPVQENLLDAIPLFESFPTDPLYALLDLVESPYVSPEDAVLSKGGYGYTGLWNELGSLFESKRPPLLLSNNEKTDTELREEKKAKRCREEKSNNNSSITKVLTRQTISRYFYMPITQAARELNVGLTLLKKRCRHLGIRRWPHRKLMSLQTLIKNVQELGKSGEGSEVKLREAIEILERERKLLEEMPDMQLENKTKRLRQACFKANYKKRKLLGMNINTQCTSSGACSRSSLDATITNNQDCYEDDDDAEETKSLLFCDSYSSSNIML